MHHLLSCFLVEKPDGKRSLPMTSGIPDAYYGQKMQDELKTAIFGFFRSLEMRGAPPCRFKLTAAD
ncbi:hypothetical protein C7W93_16665 [Glaciimonas sp. PCH181]|nr:hypothetical protein C7W93_16665 [Glaciimonas sp. PCH181]